MESSLGWARQRYHILIYACQRECERTHTNTRPAAAQAALQVLSCTSAGTWSVLLVVPSALMLPDDNERVYVPCWCLHAGIQAVHPPVMHAGDSLCSITQLCHTQLSLPHKASPPQTNTHLLAGVFGPLRTQESHGHEVVIPAQVAGWAEVR